MDTRQQARNNVACSNRRFSLDGDIVQPLITLGNPRRSPRMIDSPIGVLAE
ncbi:MAG: hypothetical protein IPL79_00330 [Myxococcales bacterium]|nr:hypothetical protein [Myxococcales bacterium]